nr:RNA-directed DNA polymerase, eukaryota [Tanacetum cinerariifolium]
MISHIFYADDAIFMGEWSDSNMANVVKILRCFFLSSVSIGGRLTLLKSVLEATPLYNMSINKGPIGILKEMETIHSNFLREQIIRQERFLGSLRRRSWRQSKMEKWIKIRWWVLRWALFLSMSLFENVSVMEPSVSDGAERQQWSELCEILEPIILSSSKDRWTCDLNGDGEFRVKEVHSLLDNIFLPSTNVPTRWVKFIPIKINIFAWRAWLDRLSTRSNLMRKGVVMNYDLCPMCGMVTDDIFHVLFRCDLAALIFQKICRWWELDWQALTSFKDWNVCMRPL